MVVDGEVTAWEGQRSAYVRFIKTYAIDDWIGLDWIGLDWTGLQSPPN